MIIINHEYHAVLISSFPDTVYDWLHNKMGMSGERWFIRHKIDGTMIYFKDERDHLIFLLAWGK
jgi:hypothetical protein